MRVYVLMRYGIEDADVEAVFANETDCNAAAEALNTNDVLGIDVYGTSEFEVLDHPLEILRIFRRDVDILSKTGEVVNVTQKEYSEIVNDRNAILRFKPRGGYIHHSGGFGASEPHTHPYTHLYVLGTDVAAVTKVCKETIELIRQQVSAGEYAHSHREI